MPQMAVYNDFDRAVLRETIARVREHFPNCQIREAWVYKTSTDQWEFHFDDFYWYGDASNAWEARAKGWDKWLESQGVAE